MSQISRMDGPLSRENDAPDFACVRFRILRGGVDGLCDMDAEFRPGAAGWCGDRARLGGARSFSRDGFQGCAELCEH
jgi:hypothetical protein